MSLKAAVIGVGSMGASHARVYSELAGVDLVSVCDTDAGRCSEVAARHDVEPVSDFRALSDKVDLVSIAVPTVAHSEVAAFFLERGVSSLLEKPMTSTSAEAAALVEAAEKSGATLMVGHIERFNPAFMAIDRMGTEPLFIECDRISPFKFRSADVGVVFDLMIHDIDIILSLARSKVEKIDACGVSVIGRQEDICNARILFENGCIANVTASRVSTKSMRKIRLFSHESYITIDYAARQAMIYRKSDRFALEAARVLKSGAASLADLAGMSFPDLLEIQEVVLDDHEPLAKELEAFCRAVKDGSPPPVTGRDGLEAVSVAEMVLASVKEHEKRLQR